jgi:dihydrofolate synthase / folylpolyglutamate synthase
MNKTLKYLYNLKFFGMKLGLANTINLAKAVGNPQERFKSIHIAGTNGKGSTAAFIATILRKAGYKVGLFTSPHLIRFNERIQINGKEITDQELTNYTKEIKKCLGKIKPTFFEFTTVLAFLYFARNKIDFAVIETGLGGRLDSTNILNPTLSIITNISIDHQKHLGNSILQIAKEKAAIIKSAPAITAEKNEEVLSIFKNHCKSNRLYSIKQAKLLESNLDFQDFSLEGKKYRIKLLGKHQLDNAALAIEAVKQIRKEFPVSELALTQGLVSTTWPGRLQIISKEPLIIVDCAHNVGGMKNLREFVAQFSKKTLILGIAKDKEISKMVSTIVPEFDKVIVTKGSFKPASLALLEREVRKHTSKVKKTTDIKKAMKEAEAVTIIAGSIYMVGDVLKKFSQKGIKQI